jgi:hypothetical protein
MFARTFVLLGALAAVAVPGAHTPTPGDARPLPEAAVSIVGRVTSANSGQPVSAAQVFIDGENVGVLTRGRASTSLSSRTRGSGER